MSLTLEHVTFRYPGSTEDILDGVSLRVRKGESVAVMGPSGRGKSTLLSVAGLLLVPQNGRVLLDDVPRRPPDAPGLLGNTVSWILQSVNLLPRRSILDNVAIPLLATGSSRSAAIAEAERGLHAVGIDPRDNRQVRTLSGGQAQRVGVARALVTRPSVILADEPTANLDAATAASVARVLFEAATDAALLVTTHDPDVAHLADRIVRLNDDDR